jgi:hypothetical protein
MASHHLTAETFTEASLGPDIQAQALLSFAISSTSASFPLRYP